MRPPTLLSRSSQIEPLLSAAEVDSKAQYAEALGVVPSLATVLNGVDLERVHELSLQVVERAKAAESPSFALPSTAIRVINLVAQDMTDMGELARLVSSDQETAATVLRVANSAANAPQSGVVTVRQAISQLGTREVGRIAGAVAARSLFNPQAKAERAVFRHRFHELHLDAASAAASAAYLAMELRLGHADTAYLGGMLHDIGKPIALSALASMHLSGKLPQLPSAAMVDAVLEKVHVEIGADAHVAWSLPDYLTTLCACHHDEHVPDSAEYAETHLVRLVDGILELHRDWNSPHLSDEMLRSACTLRLTPRALRALKVEVGLLRHRMAEALMN